MPLRKICVYTGTRAESGLLSGVMREIADDPDLALQVMAGGTHFDPRYGETWREIGHAIDWQCPCVPAADTPLEVARASGKHLGDVAEGLDRLKPDIFVVLGDRWEAHSAVTAAVLMRVPVAHIHGGELTMGAIDNALRHSMTMMSDYHFVAAPEYYDRVRDLLLAVQPRGREICAS